MLNCLFKLEKEKNKDTMGLKEFIKGGVDKYNEHKEFMIEWQNTVYTPEKPLNKLIIDERDLKNLTTSYMSRSFEIIQDCVKTLNETTKPDTFFMRLNLMRDNVEYLYKLEKFVPFSSLNNQNISAKDLYNEFTSEYDEAVHQFLVRYFCTVLDKAERLKTPKARIRQYEKFFSSLEDYFEFMSDENIDYVETKYNAYTRSERK